MKLKEKLANKYAEELDIEFDTDGKLYNAAVKDFIAGFEKLVDKCEKLK
jgi:uncharacterized beta-barrel protein YwiB (DUF1934 family)